MYNLMLVKLTLHTSHSLFVIGFWKTYHLHTNEIIRISDFAPLWLKSHSNKIHFYNDSGNEGIPSIYTTLFT